MDPKAFITDLSSKLPTLIFIGIRVVFIAIIFEFLAWLAGNRIEKLASPFIGVDAGRDPKWRAQRRATLRQTPKLITRTLLYTVALILVFDVFGVPVLPLSLAVGAVAALFGTALLPIFRDYAAGYVLLSEDTLAPGDVVEINGHQGQVERWTLRGTWLRDSSGRQHVLSNREIREVIVFRRAAEEQAAKPVAAFDPLAEAAPPKQLPGQKI